VLDERLRSVAMVDVPIHDQHARASQCLRVPGGEHDTIEEAKPHRPLRERMVTGRTRGAEGGAALQSLFDCRKRHSGAGQHRLQASRAEQRVCVERTAAACGQRLEHVDVSCGMDALDRGARRGWRLNPRDERR